MLKDSEGSWVDDQKDLQNLALNFYKDLFCEEEEFLVGVQCDHSFPQLDSSWLAGIGSPLSL